MEVSHRAGNVGEKENQITNAGFYICKHCNHTSSSLAATRDHLEGFHKDKVITDDDFISSVIYRQASSESESKTTASNDKKKSSVSVCFRYIVFFKLSGNQSKMSKRFNWLNILNFWNNTW